MTWGQFILVALRLLDWALRHGRDKRLISQGEDQAIARAMAEVLRKTDAAKRTMEEIYAMDDAQVDELLRSLEPPGRPAPGGPA